MSIRYENTFADIMAFCFYHYSRSPFVLAANGIFLALFLIVVVMVLPPEVSLLAKVFTVLVAAVILFLLLAGLLAISIVLSMISRRNKTLLTEHTITLNEDLYIEETAYNRTEHKWAGVQKLARTKTHLFIYVAQYMAHVVPRRAFRDSAEWDSFYDFCRTKTPAN